MAEAAPGRFALGLGTSSDVIVTRWNSTEFTEPYKRVRDTIAFLRSALAGEKVDHQYDTFSVRGFRLARPVPAPPPIFLAALRPGMLRLAGREADGVIINWLSAEDVATVTPELGARHPGGGPDLRLPLGGRRAVRAVGRRMIAAYLNVGVYAAFHRWLGRGPELEPMWEAWQAGDRKAALAAIPDEVVDALVVHGSYDECRAHVARYVANGVDIPVLAVIPLGVSLEEAVEASPRCRRRDDRRVPGRGCGSVGLVLGHDLGVHVPNLIGQIQDETVELGSQAGIGQGHDPDGQ